MASTLTYNPGQKAAKTPLANLFPPKRIEVIAALARFHPDEVGVPGLPSLKPHKPSAGKSGK